MNNIDNIVFESVEPYKYRNRILFGRFINFLFIIFGLISFASAGFIESVAVLSLLGVYNDFYLRYTSKFFIIKLSITSKTTEIWYVIKDSEIIKISDDTNKFHFKRKPLHWGVFPTQFLAVMYNGVELLKQFKYNKWETQKFYDIDKEFKLLRINE